MYTSAGTIGGLAVVTGEVSHTNEDVSFFAQYLKEVNQGDTLGLNQLESELQRVLYPGAPGRTYDTGLAQKHWDVLAAYHCRWLGLARCYPLVEPRCLYLAEMVTLPGLDPKEVPRVCQALLQAIIGIAQEAEMPVMTVVVDHHSNRAPLEAEGFRVVPSRKAGKERVQLEFAITTP